MEEGETVVFRKSRGHPADPRFGLRSLGEEMPIPKAPEAPPSPPQGYDVQNLRVLRRDHVLFPSKGLRGRGRRSACSGHSNAAPGPSSSTSATVTPLGHGPKSSPQAWFRTNLTA